MEIENSTNKNDIKIPNDTNQSKDRFPSFVLVILMLCLISGVFSLLKHHNTNPKTIGIDNNISTNVYNEAFDNGVSCGVDALMFFVQQGKKELNRNEIYNKAQEIRKTKEIK